MNPSLYFFAHGTPAPGGSKTVFPVWRKDGTLVTETRNGRVWPVLRVTDDAGEGNKRWRAAVALQAKVFMQGRPPYDEDMQVELIFYVRRPQHHYGTGKNAGVVKESAPKRPGVRPDALKLARSTEDAMTGIVWKDDATTTDITSRKRYAGGRNQEGCAIYITLLREGPPAA